MTINLRDELKEILKKHWDFIIVRHMTDVKCGCLSLREAANIADPQCPNCDGAGYIFEEHYVKCKVFWSDGNNSRMHNFNYGMGYGNSYRVYLEASDLHCIFKKNDFVFTLATDLEGKVKDPFVRLEKYSVIDCQILKLDNGKVEFVKLYLKPNIV